MDASATSMKIDIRKRWNAFTEAASPINPYPHAAHDIERLRGEPGAWHNNLINLEIRSSIID